MATPREHAERATAALCGLLRIPAADHNRESIATVIERTVINATVERGNSEREGVVAPNQIERLLSASPSVIYSFAARGDFAPTFVSDNIRRLFGYDPSEYLTDPGFWRERVHPDDLARVETEI